MRKEHKNIQKWIKEKYSNKFDVAAETIDGQNNLPNKKMHIYQPDVLLKSKKSGKIVYIVEVENDPMRKVLVGASILADYSVKLLQNTKPTLIFVVYLEKGIRQIPNFIEKIKIVKKYCSNLKDIKIFSITDFKRLNL